jgi:sugar lactone lactonase YvrE
MQSYAIPATAATTIAKYGNIIFLERPVHNGDLFSRRHPKMSNRAKIFAPFAALVGFDDRVRRKEISYVSKVELDADEEWELNRRLRILHELTANSKLARINTVDVTVEYYAVCTDMENDAYMEKGQYLTVTGRVVKIDQHKQEIKLMLNGNTHIIRFSDVHRIEDPGGRLF